MLEDYEDLSEYEKEPHTFEEQANAVVVHAVKTKQQIYDLVQWLINENTGLFVNNARWLLGHHRRVAKQHSAVVLYLSRPTKYPNQGIQLGRRRLRTTSYDPLR